MQKILIISFSIIHNDPRVMRQINLLETRYQLTVVGYGKKPSAKIDFSEIFKHPSELLSKLVWATKLFVGAYENYYWSLPHVVDALRKLAGKKFDLVLANDISALPLALKVADGLPVILDAHEYSPREFDDRWLWKLIFGRYYDYTCRRYVPQTTGMTTVCKSIAEEYALNYGVCPQVIHNAPHDQKLSPSHMERDRIRLVHHGAAIRSRHLEQMIEMMKYLDNRFTLDLMLMESDLSYLYELRKKADNDERIKFIKPVPMPDICRSLNAYDFGLYILPPVNFNHEHALPNKLFEFIQARLAVAIGPSPEMARLINHYGCGVVAENFKPETLAFILQNLTYEQIETYKRASDIAANELSYEHDGKVLLAEIEGALVYN